MNLARVICLEYQPFMTWKDDQKIRVFFWDELKDSQPFNTIYEWNKSKYGANLTNGHGISAEEIRFSALKMRKIINDFIEHGPTEMLEFLYSSESKEYIFWMINPKI